jgi:hypothetical protein
MASSIECHRQANFNEAAFLAVTCASGEYFWFE